MKLLEPKYLREVSGDFTWGAVIAMFAFDMDGVTCTIVKYHPWVSENGNIRMGRPDESQVLFHNTETRYSDDSIQASIIRWIAHTNLGLNQQALVAGICKALDVKAAS